MPIMRRPETYIARKLRKGMSLPEVLLWQRLRGGSSGVKFRRQHPIGPYVADFCCLSSRLVIEIDGEVHDRGQQPEHDDRKDMFLKENGYQVHRILAADVLRDADGVAAGIAALVTNPLHLQPSVGGPPPRIGEDLGADAATIPPQNGEGDHDAQLHGGGGSPKMRDVPGGAS